MEWNEEPMDGEDPLDPAPPAAPRRQPRPRYRSYQGGSPVFGSISDYGHHAAKTGAMGQGAHLGGMIGMTMGAINQENRSRVAQAQEARRMQHEKDMLLSRLGAMSGQQEEPGLTAQQMAALAVLQSENAAGHRGTIRNKALRILGML